MRILRGAVPRPEGPLTATDREAAAAFVAAATALIRSVINHRRDELVARAADGVTDELLRFVAHFSEVRAGSAVRISSEVFSVEKIDVRASGAEVLVTLRRLQRGR